jgi:SAM-dependent methyltransferase
MFHVFTDFPFASNDQFGAPYEWSTRDSVLSNSSVETNIDYIKTVYKLFPQKKQISILDIGCGPGSFLEPFIEDGNIVLGLDGFYVNRKFGVGPWGRFPNNFFNCDIAKPFKACYDEYGRINSDNLVYEFDIISTFEFMEHLYYEQLDQVFNNMYKHLKNGGIIVAGISFNQQGGHFIIENRQWWIDKFKEFGLINSKSLENIMNNNYQKYYPTSHYLCFRKKDGI